MGTLQPYVFAGSSPFGFWGGVAGISMAKREAFYIALNKSTDEIFPLRFSASAQLATGVLTGCIEGFFQRNDAYTKVDGERALLASLRPSTCALTRASSG